MVIRHEDGQMNMVKSTDVELIDTSISEYKRVDQVFGSLSISQCFSCKKFAVWVNKSIVYPRTYVSIPPNPDLPDDIKADYLEAASIVDQSPRSAAGLLRLCIHKLCAFLGSDDSQLDKAIGKLVKDKGLSPLVQQSLDVVRLTGNAALHERAYDREDTRVVTMKLFQLINVIVEQTITLPKHVDALLKQFPEDKKKAIERRDAPKA